MQVARQATGQKKAAALKEDKALERGVELTGRIYPPVIGILREIFNGNMGI